MNFPRIITERLLLRRLKPSDWEMISYLRSDKKVNEFVKRPSAKSKEKALEFISKINCGVDNRNLYYWTITEKNNSEMIGSICLWNFSGDQRSAEVGYDLNPKFQRKGIMNESLKRVVEFGFKELNLDLIEAYTHKKNERSKKLLERNGFALVKNKKDEHNRDNVIYGIKKESS
ncbi:GNAT family N-acetyltransferase [Galbibacter sp. EGI 63066]|uniref:GNAT family N-acetyltransferase n=1 Tax=Galbibacter sp. EGI 63066 TaxID=2993559 RepID=UPI002248840F|nr:GNAT family N-acetyltransferase [Galbibacter sp. EGI 63066]MCX2681732.1 GNAT family N-acetyltransferase [Galbibacter sp. EGI 63066]